MVVPSSILLVGGKEPRRNGDDKTKKQTKEEQQSKDTTTTKSVNFPDDNEESFVQVVCEVESCFDFSDEDKKAMWFTRSDYHFSRSSARVIAKESERYGHSKHLDDAYVGTYNQQIQDQLNLWALHGHSRRGLERWASTGHGIQRKDDQYMYINGLLRAQQEMKLKDIYTEERLREVGHILSRKSRLFAHMMGAADAEAAKWSNLGMNAMGGMVVPSHPPRGRPHHHHPQHHHLPPHLRHHPHHHHPHHHRRPLNLGLQGPSAFAGRAIQANSRLPSRRASDSQPMLRRPQQQGPGLGLQTGAARPAVARRSSAHQPRTPPKITINTARRGSGGRQARMA